MDLPFTADQFFDVFRDYNQAIWPFQTVLNALAILGMLMAFKKYRLSNPVVAGVLSFLWIWMGFAYHILYFSVINPAATMFGIFFILQGLLFLYFLAYKNELSFGFRKDLYGWVGALFILFALVVYPIIGYTQDHTYPSSPTFGLPCPTTIFTLGILLWADKKVPLILVIIPVAWSFIGFTASFALGVTEDIGLLVSGLIFMVMMFLRRKPAIG